MASQLPKTYSEVKLVNGELVDQIRNCKPKQWMRACERLGDLVVMPEKGKGAHCSVYKPNCPSGKRKLFGNPDTAKYLPTDAT